MILGVSQAYAEVTIETAIGSGAPGCEDTADGCYLPMSVTASIDEIILFKNTDTVAHTFTSSIADNGPDGLFDKDSSITHPVVNC